MWKRGLVFFVGAASGVFIRGEEETVWKRRLTAMGELQ